MHKVEKTLRPVGKPILENAARVAILKGLATVGLGKRSADDEVGSNMVVGIKYNSTLLYYSVGDFCARWSWVNFRMVTFALTYYIMNFVHSNWSTSQVWYGTLDSRRGKINRVRTNIMCVPFHSLVRRIQALYMTRRLISHTPRIEPKTSWSGIVSLFSFFLLNPPYKKLKLGRSQGEKTISFPLHCILPRNWFNFCIIFSHLIYSISFFCTFRLTDKSGVVESTRWVCDQVRINTELVVFCLKTLIHCMDLYFLLQRVFLEVRYMEASSIVLFSHTFVLT